MVCITLFETSVNFTGKITSSLVVAFSWNGQTHGSFLQPKSWVYSSFPRHRSHTAFSNLTEVSVTEMSTSDTVFQEYNTHVRTVVTRRSFFPSPFSAPGNEASLTYNSVYCCINRWAYFERKAPFATTSLKKRGVGLFLGDNSHVQLVCNIMSNCTSGCSIFMSRSKWKCSLWVQ